MQNLHGLIVLVKPFPTVGGMPRFLMVKDIFPLKDDNVIYGQEALNKPQI
jgi:hypothetical protein